MRRFTEGDRVRVDIPDQEDPDHGSFHDRRGTVTDILVDEAGTETGDERDNTLYTVEFDDGSTMDFRWRDLRPL